MIAAAVCLPAAVPAQQAEPLSAEELAVCAERVQTLRETSARLNRQAAQLDQRRAELGRRYAALSDKARAGDGEAHERLLRYNAEATAFNKEVAEFRREVEDINAVKRAYDRECSGRPFSRPDLNHLPEAARTAMRAGLADVQVPYTDPAELPVPKTKQ